MTILSDCVYLLRPFEDADAPTFIDAVLESQATVGKWMAWAHGDYGEKEALAWFRVCASNRAIGAGHEFGVFREACGTLVGGAGLNQINKANNLCNLGYWIRQSSQRKGAAAAAIRALADFAFMTLKFTRVEIVVAEGNLPSLGAARNSGATEECLARNRLLIHGSPVSAHVFSLVPAP